MSDKKLILVTNDDGIEAKGVHELIQALPKDCRIVCVCPDSPRSAQGMAITVNTCLRLHRLEDYEGAEMYKANGTPVDCVKLAIDVVLKRKPDLVVAGINHGSNAGVNVIYSGTMGAVFEGCAFGIPSVGFSLTSHSMDADFNGCKPFISEIVGKVIENGLPEGVCLNVNVPVEPLYPKEMRVVRGCKGKWTDNYEEYTDPFGGKFYLLTGTFINEEPENEETDEWCLSHGIVSVVPTMLDRTAPDLHRYKYLSEH